ncbi:MAG: methyltransferase domain-containing protein [Anaerolinea sp.]|nr:methyltransferase domain-containing protein [Anaerolinea sp.]
MPERDHEALIANLKAAGLLADPRLERAFRAVPREHFLPKQNLETVYADEAVAIKRGVDGSIVSSSSQPSMMAIMLNALRLVEGCNVLEIGTGTGYNAAIMRQMVGTTGKVTSIEIDKEVVSKALDSFQRAGISGINVVEGDGVLGYAPRAAYDRIIASVGVWDMPPMWVRQLKPDGILVVPIWWDAYELCAAFTFERDGTLISTGNSLCSFVDLRGGGASPPLSVRVGTTALRLETSAVARLDPAALHLLLSDDASVGQLSHPVSYRDHWTSFIPYLILNTPPGFILAHYYVSDSAQKPYGIEGSGFALLTQGSACFVPVTGEGITYSYGGADAFMGIEETLKAWNAAGRPKRDRLRLRLIPNDRPIPAVSAGKLYPRRSHRLHVWMEGETL